MIEAVTEAEGSARPSCEQSTRVEAETDTASDVTNSILPSLCPAFPCVLPLQLPMPPALPRPRRSCARLLLCLTTVFGVGLTVLTSRGARVMVGNQAVRRSLSSSIQPSLCRGGFELVACQHSSTCIRSHSPAMWGLQLVHPGRVLGTACWPPRLRQPHPCFAPSRAE